MLATFFHRSRFALFLIAAGCFNSAAANAAEPAKKMNVLFIAIDDLRDWIHYLGMNGQVQTPNLDRLAQRGVSFSRSYCAAPVCNPSRTALLSGLRPSTTGVYDNDTDWRTCVSPDIATLPQHFKQQGYYVAGAGKIFHGGFGRDGDWSHYYRDKEGKERGSGAGVGGIRFEPLDCTDEDMVDYRSVTYTLEQLKRPREQPFFLACGLHKPHMPWNVPRKYYDLYPLDSIVLPKVLDTDLDDVPPAGVRMARPDVDHAAILRSGRWKDAVQGYLAAITFADAMVGRLLDGLDQSPERDNTMIVLWCDHGWHLGEKLHWRKFTLWEEATRAPLIFVVPGLTKPGVTCERTVDFMSIYPTLTDLCGLPTPDHVKGPSLRPLLENTAAVWDRPAVTTHHYNNHAVRTEKWRYIRYNDGGEELYDEIEDPKEWVNLALKSEFSSIKAELAKWLPTDNTAEGKEEKKAAVSAAERQIKKAKKAAKRTATSNAKTE